MPCRHLHIHISGCCRIIPTYELVNSIDKLLGFECDFILDCWHYVLSFSQIQTVFVRPLQTSLGTRPSAVGPVRFWLGSFPKNLLNESDVIVTVSMKI